MAIQKFNTVAELRIAIQQLEIKQANEWPPLKKQLLATAETLKPKHIIKDIFRDVFSEPTLKATAVNTTLGVAAMLAANFFFPSKTISSLTKLITGTIIGVTTMGKIVSHGGHIKSLGNSLLKRLTSKQSTL
jgi:hypothetical protein